MRCYQCNTINDGTHRFCQNCGHELNIRYNNPNINVVMVKTTEKRQKRRTRNRQIVIWLLVLALIIVATILLFIIQQTKMQNENIPLTIDAVTVQDEKKGIVLIEGYTKSDIKLICNMGIVPKICTENMKY